MCYLCPPIVINVPMAAIFKRTFTIVTIFFTLGFSAHAQLKELFTPFDCRQLFETTSLRTPLMDTLSQVAMQALVETDVQSQTELDTINGWRTWQTIGNFTYGKDRGGMPMIVELQALHPYFRDRVIDLINGCKEKGIQLAVVESYRTHAKQNEYKTMGKKYTRSGGGKSKHQYGLAVDLVPIVDSVAVWDDIALWKKVGLVGEKLGLRWGGRWRKPYDPGHFEWTGGLTTTDLIIGKLPPILKKDVHYPCIEEDLKLLRKFWREWEIEQSSLARR